MARPRTTRGPLPPGVYWRRRAFVLGVLASLVLLTLNLVRGGEGDPPERASTSAATASETPAAGSAAQRGDRSRRSRVAPSGPVAGPTAPPLAEPDGSCRPEDVVVSPVVDHAVAGQPVTITLRLRTLSSPACTWTLAARNVALKITDDDQEVWTSQECPRAVPAKEVVVRRQVVSTATLTWDGRRSDVGCSRTPPSAPVPGGGWVLPGSYEVYAATLGGEPVASSFELAEPEPETVAPDPVETEPAGESAGESVAQPPGTVTPPRTNPDSPGRGRSGGR